MLSNNNLNRIHRKWPVGAFICSDNLEKIILINTNEGKIYQIIETSKNTQDHLSCICWHDELLILCIGYKNFIEIWILENDRRYTELLDEGLSAPSFDLRYQEYYNEIYGENFNINDIFGINIRKRLDFFWFNRYNNLKLSLFRILDINESINLNSRIDRITWIDNDKMIVQHHENNKTYLSIWKSNIETFNIDVYDEIKSRRIYDKKLFFIEGESDKIYIDILTEINNRPILHQKLDIKNKESNLEILIDESERFILIYQLLNNEIYIFRYEELDNDLNDDKKSGIFVDILPPELKYQKIVLKENEYIINADWKPNTSSLAYNVKRERGINEISIFTIITRINDDIYIRIWRETSLNKPCLFIQALLLHFYDKCNLKNTDIRMTWEDFRDDNEMNIFDNIQIYDRHYCDLIYDNKNQSFYYSSRRFPLLELDNDDYFYYNFNKDDMNFNNENIRSFIPIKSCIHNDDIFLINENQKKELRMIVFIGQELYYFKIFQLNIWNDEINPSITRLDMSLNGFPKDHFQVISFSKNCQTKREENIYTFIILLRDFNIVKYIFDEDKNIWYYIKNISSQITDINTNNNGLYGKEIIELYNMNLLLLLMSNGELYLISKNFEIKKMFKYLYVRSSILDQNSQIYYNDDEFIYENYNSLLNIYKNEVKYDQVIELLDFNIDGLFPIKCPLLTSHYSFILTICNLCSKLNIIGLNNNNITSSIYIELVDINSMSNFCDIDDLDIEINEIHKNIMEILFNRNIINLKYKIRFLENYFINNNLGDIYICIVEDLELGINHMIIFKLELEKTITKYSNNKLILKILSPIKKTIGQFKQFNYFELINLKNIDHCLIFITNELFHKDEYNENTQNEFNQLYIYVCELNNDQGNIKIDIIKKIMLNKSFNNNKSAIKIKSLDYNIIIYDEMNKVLQFYSLISLNMFSINDKDEYLIQLNPFQEIELNKNLIKNDLDFSQDFQLYLLQDFHAVYFCVLNYEFNTIVIYWNKDICKWEFSESIDILDHFQMQNINIENLINIQKLELIDGILFFFKDQLIPKLYKRQNSILYEKENNISLNNTDVLEDFVFSLNDKKQLFSIELFKKISESNHFDNKLIYPNLNIIPYNICDSDVNFNVEYRNDNIVSLKSNYENDIFEELYTSLLSLSNNKQRDRMSIVEIEEYNLKRYIIRNKYYKKRSDFIIRSEDICWILLCEKEYIINNIFEDNIMDWNELKKYGIIYIFTNNVKFQEFIEEWVHKLYQKFIKIISEKRREISFELKDIEFDNCKDKSKETEDDIINIVIIIYTCLNKLNIVSAIFKILEQKNVFDFLLNYDFNNENMRKQAMKNGYYLIKQRKYYWSICFFTLSRSYKEIVNVCIKYLNDPQLLLLLLRLLINTKKDNFEILSVLFNEYMNDIWLLSLLNKDPWLCIISIMNYHCINYKCNKFDIYNTFLKLSSPSTFLSICEQRINLHDFYNEINENSKSNYHEEIINIDNEELKDNYKICNIQNCNSYDLNYSFIHPEHLLLYHKYIKKKISNNFLLNDLKYPSFEYIIEVMCYYIKKSMNPYHYMSWFYYIEENKNLFEFSKYYRIYELIIKPNILNKIMIYIKYIHLNYFLLNNEENDNLLNWFKRFKNTYKNLFIFNLDIDCLHCSWFDKIDPHNLKIFINYIIDSLLKLKDISVNMENVGFKDSKSENVYDDLSCFAENEFNSTYICIELIISNRKGNVININDLLSFYCHLNNNIVSICDNDDSNKNIKYEFFLLFLWNQIYEVIVRIFTENINEYQNTNLMKIHILKRLIQYYSKELIDNTSIHLLLTKLCQFAIISSSIHKLRVFFKNNLNKESVDKIILILKLIFLFNKNYYENNDNIDISEFINVNEEISLEKLEGLELSTVCIVLVTGILKIHQDLLNEFKKKENDNSIQEVQYIIISHINILLKEYYFNKQFILWKEIVIKMIPLLLNYFNNSFEDQNSLLFIELNNTNIKDHIILRLLQNMWNCLNIKNTLLINIIRNRDIIVSYSNNSISNLYHNIIIKNEISYPFKNFDNLDIESKEHFSANIANSNKMEKLPLNFSFGHLTEKNNEDYFSHPLVLDITIYNQKIIPVPKLASDNNNRFNYYKDDPYYSWFIKNDGNLLDLLYQDHPILIDCFIEQNSPFFIESNMNHLFLNSKIYFIHPNTFIKNQEFINSISYEEKLFTHNIKKYFKIEKLIKLEILLNSILLKKFSKFNYHIENDFNLLSYFNKSIKLYETDFCINIKKNIKSFYLECASKDEDIKFIQIFSDIPLNFSKVKNQFNIKAIICGEYIQIKDRSIRQIIYPYWSHSLPFNNYKIQIHNQLSIPKPIILNNKSQLISENENYNDSLREINDTQIGTINHVNWCPNKLNIILSTSNGYILIYKLNSENEYSINDDDEIFLSKNGNLSSEKHPFIPIFKFHSHKNNCYWSNIIDYSCRYIITCGNGINFLNKSDSLSNNITYSYLSNSNNIVNSGTLTLAEFMGDNTLNLNSNSDIKTLLSDENCLCIWDIWSKQSCNDPSLLLNQPDLLIALESSPILNCHNWKLCNQLIAITSIGNIWFISYKYGRQFLTPTLFKLNQKNILNSCLEYKSHNINKYYQNSKKILFHSKLTVISTDGTCIIYNIFLYSINDPTNISIIPVIKYNIYHSNSMNPLNIINNSFSSSQLNKVISHAIFIDENTLIIIDNSQICKVIKLLPFFK